MSEYSVAQQMLTYQLLDFKSPKTPYWSGMEEIKEEKIEICFSDKILKKIHHEVRHSLGKVTLNNL